ncbi:hypothetical protein RhiirA1_457640 [Rhizophagus irregularis]|uniref:Uncharacterized protein n=1 Tax=Rhizophagus irregularis TaxID=588596 RepID=A0A2N0RXV1_9GLOM|nr:hypothetical protein RhiirA1_457640 [Rhizophagus irregularis]
MHTKYEWLEIGHIRKGFVNFQAKSYKAYPICGIKYERDQLYGFLRSNGYFVLKCYRQNQYKPDHKGLTFGEVSGIIKPKERPKWELNDRLINVVKNPHLLSELSRKNINVKETEEAPEAYPDFLSSVCSMTLIRSPVDTANYGILITSVIIQKFNSADKYSTGKIKALRGILNSLAGNRENFPCFIWISYRKTFTNETKAKIEILQNLGLHVCQYQKVEGSLAISDWNVIIIQIESIHHIELHGRRSYVVILDEDNVVIRQMSSGEKKENPEPWSFLSMEKNPERARELLTWIRDAIKAKKLSDPVFTESGTHNTWPFNEFLKQEPYKTIPKKLRDYGSKHASRIYGGDNYAIGDTESEDSGPESDHESVSKASDSPKPQTQASSPASQPNPQHQAKRKSQQTMDMDSIGPRKMLIYVGYQGA